MAMQAAQGNSWWSDSTWKSWNYREQWQSLWAQWHTQEWNDENSPWLSWNTWSKPGDVWQGASYQGWNEARWQVDTRKRDSLASSRGILTADQDMMLMDGRCQCDTAVAIGPRDDHICETCGAIVTSFPNVCQCTRHRRMAHRFGGVLAVYASPHYRQLEGLPQRPPTPDPFDESLSKRRWESAVMQWRNDLADLAKDLVQ